MTINPLPDKDARNQAQDISQSFIVQAPAGSGKTELLSLRFLKLLAASEQPENVLAITFTRKAAAEMSDRIIKALADTARQLQSGNDSCATEHERQRFELARAVLNRNKQLNWQLLENPGRLRIQTIDSFCLYLGRQLPVLSRLGGNPGISEDMRFCFQDAIKNTLQLLDEDTGTSRHIGVLLRHLDNNVGRVESLLSGLLAKRDQWLSYIVDINNNYDNVRDYLQNSLNELVSESLDEVAEGLRQYRQDIVELSNFAGENLRRDNRNDGVDVFIPLQGLPANVYGDIQHWKFVANLLLTKDDNWRRQIRVTEGFPAGDKKDKEFDALCRLRKEQHGRLLEALRTDDDLLESLTYMRRLPNPAYEDQHWIFITSLCHVLSVLSAQLLLSFRKFHLIDYTQVGAAASNALGSDEAPTDLALALDYRLQHILVDEFQDTSRLQHDILLQLTAGWMPGDGRSLFLVGDPMQSVYQFRNANVGIFLGVQSGGLGNLKIQPLTLQTNFRSHARVVDWVNRIFAAAFPRRKNYSRGAVPYSPSVAGGKVSEAEGVRTILVSVDRDDMPAAKAMEAQQVQQRILQIRSACPGQSIAVLVRTRSQLNVLLPVLRQAGISWQSTDIDTLASLPVIEDLLSLTRALLNPVDRIAWLALLRAPWCGLNAADLLAVCQMAQDRSIWSALEQPDALTNLSADARARLAYLVPILGYGLKYSGRVPLRQLLETLWTMLCGPATVRSIDELESVSAYFDLLEIHSVNGGLANPDEFADLVATTYIPSARDSLERSDLVHILTMHKAKGLEFDHVILPGLANMPRSDEKSLLLWHERLNRAREPRLFIAALSAAGKEDDPLYELLRHEQRHKARLESTRLLYIAVTRARRSVTLLASLARDGKGNAGVPADSSLLARIWRELNATPDLLEILELPTAPAVEATTDHYPCPTPIRRLAQPLSLTPGLLAVVQTPLPAGQIDMVGEYDPAAALCGTLIHRALQTYVEQGPRLLEAAPWRNLQAYWRRELKRLTRSDSETEKAVDFIGKSIQDSVTDTRFLWLFDAGQTDNHCELTLGTRKTTTTVARYVIDRTLVDAQGNRWIIDYKTVAPDAAVSLETFIAGQKTLHQAQLAQYRSLYQALEARPVRTALFFTAIPALVELV
ncbi:MAG: UvrD-helicase domain-containing protein [Pseudohongiellaceae bacterium]